jgi:uridylate kinase
VKKEPGSPVFQRVLLKLSGQALGGERGVAIDPANVAEIASYVAHAHALGVRMGIVVGGGNIFRGVAAAARGLDRVSGDHIGMLATVQNALAMQDALEKQGAETRVMSAIAMNEICEPYIRRRALRHLEQRRICIFAAGTGNPYFSTDSAAALRALEIGAEALFMAKRSVNGCYTADPEKDPTAKFIPRLTHLEAIQLELEVMDTTALSLCMDNHLPIHVFKMSGENIARILAGDEVGTLVATP